MEANRPAPVSLANYRVGQKRVDVISTLGPPKTTVQDGDKSCDVYQLYTTGNNKAQKAAVILGEAGADLFTLGLFEVVATPAEAITKSKAHTVLLCYSDGNLLQTITDEGVGVGQPRSAQAASTPAHP